MKAKLTFFTLIFLFIVIFTQDLSAKTTLNGKLLQSNGRPLAFTEIELVPLESDVQLSDTRLLAISSNTGRFSFSNVPEGRYTLSINFDEKPTETSPYATFFYPNTEIRASAEIFEINETSKFAPLTFRLPPKLIQRTITGQVIWSSGIPIADAFIYINDVDFDEMYGLTNLKTDSDGNFALKAFENRNYIVGAVLFERMGKNLVESIGPVFAATKSESFLLNANTEKIILKMEEPEDLKIRRDRIVGKLIVKP